MDSDEMHDPWGDAWPACPPTRAQIAPDDEDDDDPPDRGNIEPPDDDEDFDDEEDDDDEDDTLWARSRVADVLSSTTLAAPANWVARRGFAVSRRPFIGF